VWRALLVLAGCSFAPGRLGGTSGSDAATDDASDATDAPTDGEVALCDAGSSWPINTGGAPVGYTITVDITEALAVFPANQLHVMANSADVDRIVTGSLLDVKIPATGTLALVAGSSGAPSNPLNVYLWAQDFEVPATPALADLTVEPTGDWSVIDDGVSTNRILHAGGTGRHPAAFTGRNMADSDIRVRMRVGTGGTQQHNGIATRGNSMVAASMDGFVGQLMGDVNRTRIAEYTNGASPPVELVGDARTVTRAQWYALRMRTVGTLVELYVDGALVLTTTTGGGDGQMIGLYAHDTDVDFDDITVRMAVAPAPVATLGPRTCE
jgi:hypothetical protein